MSPRGFEIQLDLGKGSIPKLLDLVELLREILDAIPEWQPEAKELEERAEALILDLVRELKLRRSLS